MRIVLTLTPNTEPVDFNHLHKITGVVHRWLGEGNELHDSLSLYSVSFLSGGVTKKGALDFPKGSRLLFSAYDPDITLQVVSAIAQNSEFIYGMRVTDVVTEAPPDVEGLKLFHTASPVLLRKWDEVRKSFRHLLYNDPEANDVMTKSAHRKLIAAGIDPAGATLEFDPNYPNPRTSLIAYKDIKNRVSWCPIIMRGSKEAIQCIFHTGIGSSTGAGFGAIY